MTEPERAAERPTATLGTVRDSYGTWAPTYIELFGAADKASADDRAVIGGWAGTLRGAVLDAGCGPGHWSAFLAAAGLEVRGVDATPEFVAHARREHPDIPFRLGDLRHLRLPAGSLGGVLAWFSLIHTDPAEVPAVLRAFAQALEPDGGLLLGFFTGPALERFEHRVVTAWTWPMHCIADAVEEAGFDVLGTGSAPTPNGRIAAHLVARRAR
ncbi:class I SAM-dependent methyltransferase [Amnibacterium sp. CER49]|uniref:class I SAM-dependent methyltransferase n=1 Tax=Amnibacterium sp. CER49 TaxID=3039161 RepID=UPI00244C33B9|nr:class I SAM-dependent methyltransferase [Amnibacterium sp. CER49]MDH2442629.1 class I SAM-dependent methyltransferase [Amnibacterium sp. CER49]